MILELRYRKEGVAEEGREERGGSGGKHTPISKERRSVTSTVALFDGKRGQHRRSPGTRGTVSIALLFRRTHTREENNRRRELACTAEAQWAMLACRGYTLGGTQSSRTAGWSKGNTRYLHVGGKQR